MESILFLVIGLCLGGVLAWIFWDKGRRNAMLVTELTAEKEALDGKVTSLSSELKSSKAKSTSASPRATKSKPDSGAAAKENKNLKKQVHDLKKEVAALREKNTAQKAASAGVGEQDLMEIREELMVAKTETANLETKLAEAEASRDALKTKLDALQASDGEDLPVVDVDALKNAHSGEIKDTIEKFQEQIRSLKASKKADIKQLKDELLSENRALNSKLRRAQNDVDQQRRRADNNDKAYKITRLQLDNAMEKLALVDPETRAPGGYYDPEIEEILKAEAEKKSRKKRQERDKAEKEAEEKAQQAAAAEALAAMTAAAEDDLPPTVAKEPVAPAVESETSGSGWTDIGLAAIADPEGGDSTVSPALEKAEEEVKQDTKLTYQATETNLTAIKEPAADDDSGESQPSGWTAIGLAAISEVTGKPAEESSPATVTFKETKKKDNEEAADDLLAGLDTSMIDDDWDLGL